METTTVENLDTLLKNKLSATQYEEAADTLGLTKIMLGKYLKEPLRIPSEYIIKIASLCQVSEQEVVDTIKFQTKV